MYVFSGHVCFHSNVFGFIKRKSISFQVPPPSGGPEIAAPWPAERGCGLLAGEGGARLPAEVRMPHAGHCCGTEEDQLPLP
jgi:hypothetical protein